MTIGYIRDKMQYVETYFAPDLEIRLYRTNRSGTYGYQFAAIAWYKGEGYAGERTGGCGYDKASTAIDSALRKIKPEMKDWAGTGQVDEMIMDFLGVNIDKNDWRAVHEWRNNNTRHAHG